MSDSPYGTFDQGGNLREWNETAVTSSSRGGRGGSFYFSDFLHASDRTNLDPSFGYSHVGFRVASLIPEPDGLTLCVAGAMMLMLWRRKK